MKPSTTRIGLAAAVLVAGGVAACGDDDDVAPARGDDPQAAEGQQVFADSGCSDCHSTTGGSGRGPNLDGIYEEEVELTDGSSFVRDDEYLARSISDPSTDIVDGFSPQMPNFGLDGDEVDALVAYIRSLSD